MSRKGAGSVVVFTVEVNVLLAFICNIDASLSVTSLPVPPPPLSLNLGGVNGFGPRRG